MFFIPESPEYLYRFYRFTECRRVLIAIAKWNKAEDRLPMKFEFDVEVDILNTRFNH